MVAARMGVRVVEGDRDDTWGTSVWRAVAGEEELGTATAFLRPDGRCFVTFQDCSPAGYAPLLEAVAAVAPGEVAVSASEADREALALYEALGFVAASREQTYVIPVKSAVAALGGAEFPAGVTAISPDTADLDRLRLLDDELRHDVPGTAGWRWSPDAFRDETFGPQYDPALYAVAVEGNDYIGIARVWNRLPRPRLGMIGVTRPHRRRGVASALLARVLDVLHQRGITELTAEVDVTNVGSNTLMARLGGRVVGVSVDLVKDLGALSGGNS